MHGSSSLLFWELLITWAPFDLASAALVCIVLISCELKQIKSPCFVKVFFCFGEGGVCFWSFFLIA